MRTIITIVTLASVAVGVIGFIVKATWFKVGYRHVAVMMRNERIKEDRHGLPLVKEAGWRCQVPIRDDKRMIDCRVRTFKLASQKIFNPEDGKHEIELYLSYHVLSLRDGEAFKYHPALTLDIEDLDTYVQGTGQDAVRYIIATSDTPVEQWETTELNETVLGLVKEELAAVGVGFDNVRISDAAPSEAQTHGDIIKDALVNSPLEGFQRRPHVA